MFNNHVRLLDISSLTILGFSFSGATIPAGDHILVYLDGNATSDEACLDNVILAANGGAEFDTSVGSCIDLEYQEPIVHLSFGESTSTSIEISTFFNRSTIS